LLFQGSALGGISTEAKCFGFCVLTVRQCCYASKVSKPLRDMRMYKLVAEVVSMQQSVKSSRNYCTNLLPV